MRSSSTSGWSGSSSQRSCVSEPPLGDETGRRQPLLGQLLLHDAARLLRLHACGGVDEHRLAVLRDRQPMRAQFRREVVCIAPGKAKPLEQTPCALLVRQLDPDAPVVMSHRAKPNGGMSNGHVHRSTRLPCCRLFAPLGPVLGSGGHLRLSRDPLLCGERGWYDNSICSFASAACGTLGGVEVAGL